MLRSFLSCIIFLIFANAASAQLTREELETQRRQLKKEIDETQKLLASTNTKTKQGLSQWRIIQKKGELQKRVVDNIDKDLHILDNNIYTIQRDVNRYDRLLDTLKQEYAKSMIYSYKNRGNYEFLNFIFSADNFNDAIKRIAYLKSYRAYREMQGQNILRTQELRKNKLQDLGLSKQKKSTTLEMQNKEMAILEVQKEEQNKIVLALKKDAKSLNNKLAAKKKQAAKVNSLIAAAVKDAIRIAKEEAAAKTAAEEKIRKAETIKLAANSKTNPAVTSTKVAAPSRPVKTVTKPASVLLNDENIELNASFEKNRGSLPWPVDQGGVLMHYGPNKLPGDEADYIVPGITISASIGTPVKSVFDGLVKIVKDDIIVIQHGRYFTTYSNLSNISVRAGDNVKRGQVLGKVMANDDGIGTMDFQTSDEKNNFDPEKWLRSR